MKPKPAICVMVFGMIASQLSASAPETSLKPLARDSLGVSTVSVNQSVDAPSQSVRPLKRKFKVNIARTQNSQTQTPSPTLKKSVQKPKKRGWKLFSRKPKKGALCGQPGIEGEKIAAVKSGVRGCGIPEAVRVRSVDGVRLSHPATIDCPTAKALYSWVNETVNPTLRRKGGGVASIKVAAHYACRTRNNKKGARISEHGRGRAIDISAINLKDGQSLTVLKDWRSKNRKIMRKLHKGACGPFGTVLGPRSDRYHQDHFHFDTARYRSGPYCR